MSSVFVLCNLLQKRVCYACPKFWKFLPECTVHAAHSAHAAAAEVMWSAVFHARGYSHVWYSREHSHSLPRRNLSCVIRFATLDKMSSSGERICKQRNISKVEAFAKHSRENGWPKGVKLYTYDKNGWHSQPDWHNQF